MTSSTSRNKGRKGESEVVRLFRAAGFEKAARSPMSGGLRPYGAGDLSPWPGDLIGVEPWIVEVKRDERMDAPSRGWTGSGFVRGVLRDLQALQARHAAVVGKANPRAVLVARASFSPWRFFVCERDFRDWVGASREETAGQGYVELDASEFFSLVGVP